MRRIFEPSTTKIMRAAFFLLVESVKLTLFSSCHSSLCPFLYTYMRVRDAWCCFSIPMKELTQKHTLTFSEPANNNLCIIVWRLACVSMWIIYLICCAHAALTRIPFSCLFGIFSWIINRYINYIYLQLYIVKHRLELLVGESSSCKSKLRKLLQFTLKIELFHGAT